MTDPERTDLKFPPDPKLPPDPTASSVAPLPPGQTLPAQSAGAQLSRGQDLGSQSLESGSSLTSSRTLVGSLELRMEVPRVEVRREVSGQASVRRERRTRQETVVVELISEVLIIETRPTTATTGTAVTRTTATTATTVAGDGVVAGVVLLDGVELPAGETREVVLYREEALVSKQIIRAEEVRVYKQRSTVRQEFPTALDHEELVVEHRPAPETISRSESLPVPTSSTPTPSTPDAPLTGGPDESR